MRTKPSKPKSAFFSHSEDFSEKEVYDVRLEPFLSKSGKTLLNLTISAGIGNKEDNTYRGSTNNLILYPIQLNAIEIAIRSYNERKAKKTQPEEPIAEGFQTQELAAI